MQLIQSAALRDQIAEFYNDVIQHNQLRSTFRENSDPFWVAYQRHVTWDHNLEATTSDILLSTHNWETLRADEAFIFSIIGTLRNQLVIEQGRLILVKSRLSFRKSLLTWMTMQVLQQSPGCRHGHFTPCIKRWINGAIRNSTTPEPTRAQKPKV
jgi:hypothetical protein